jgi:hypothetical protein
VRCLGPRKWRGEVELVFRAMWVSAEPCEAAKRLKGRDDKQSPLGSDHGTGRPRRMGQPGGTGWAKQPKLAQDEGKRRRLPGGPEVSGGRAADARARARGRGRGRD